MKHALLLALLAGCGSAAKGPLRLGYLPNVTHAQALVGSADGTYAREIPSGVLFRGFNAGPEAAEALLSRSLDASYLGAGPALTAFIRSDGDVVVIAGAASGGSVLVTRTARTPEELEGARLATPQMGNTQDIALRTWLAQHKLNARVFPLANPDIYSLYERGQLDGAWVPEPWGARLVAAGAQVLVDERTLWPNGRCPTTVLVVRKQFLAQRPEDVSGLLRAHAQLTRRWRSEPEAFARAANAAFGAVRGKKLKDAVAKDAFSRLDPTEEPMEAELRTEAERAQKLGYLPAADLSGLVERR